MTKKRLLCILLITYLLIPLSFPIRAVALESESNELKNVTLSLYSNLSAESYISGLYHDNIFYITLEDLCALTKGKIEKESEEEAEVSYGNGAREFVIDVGSGNMTEILPSDQCNITLPSMIQDGKVYVSALHFLRYLGATVKLQEDAPIQFMVIKRYDIFDALSDLSASNSGNFFWWDEVDAGEEDLEEKLTNAGVVALINRDSNIFHMIFDAKGIEQEALEDALLSIVKNEGQGYFTENSVQSELIDTVSGLIGAEADWFDLIKEAYDDGSDVLGEQISDLASNAAITANFAKNVVGAFESLKQFDNMSTSQKNLLEKTILQYPEKSETLCDGWDIVFDAAKNISEKVQSEYDARYKAVLDIAESTAYDLLNGAVGMVDATPVSLAWSSVTLLTEMIPFTNEMIEKKSQLYNSYNCSIIQLIANEMLVETYPDWYGNALDTSVSEQYKKMDAVKQLIVLQLKSTLTTREYLINSGFLSDDYASEMKQMNQETAALLNKAENCQINGVNLFTAEYEDDISWIENCETEKTDLANDDFTLAYEAIINEYRDACSIDSENVDLGSEWNQFPNVAERMMTYYHIYGHDFDFCFVNYDIDGNGIPELLIGEKHDADNINIVDAYAFDGNSAVKIVDSDTLGDRSHLTIFTDGTMYLHSSGGASSGAVEFYCLDKDGFSLKSISSYTIDYDKYPNTPYYNNYTNDMLTYEEFNQIFNQYTEIEINDLKWNTI